MSDEQWASVSSDAGELYESILVPAIFANWAPRLLDAASVDEGDRVLDVACGTGVVARQAVERVGARGTVAGLDATEAMLAVAARLEPGVEWHLGDAAELPFDSRSFDVVVCQAGLMFFPDQVRAVSEMWRVLRPGGRVALLTWARSEGQMAFASVVERRAGPEAAAAYLRPWSLSEPDDLRRIVEQAGFWNVDVLVESGTTRFGSIDDFLTAATAVLFQEAMVDHQLAGRLRHSRRRPGASGRWDHRYRREGIAGAA